MLDANRDATVESMEGGEGEYARLEFGQSCLIRACDGWRFRSDFAKPSGPLLEFQSFGEATAWCIRWPRTRKQVLSSAASNLQQSFRGSDLEATATESIGFRCRRFPFHRLVSPARIQFVSEVLAT